MQNAMKLNFSGHESFQCRELWLKKGYDFLAQGEKGDFRSPTAVIDLGVGKNMVSAISYWMTAFNLLDQKKNFTEFADYIFGKEGKDPYLEDSATLWLLHYQLTKTNHASIYSLFFNEFRKERPEFTRRQLLNYLLRKCDENKTVVSETSITKDVGVFLNTYLKPDKFQNKLNELLSGLLVDLDLIERVDKIDKDQSSWYWVINKDRDEIPIEVILFCLLDNPDYGDSVSMHTLFTEADSIGSIFAMSTNGVVKKIKELSERHDGLIYTDDAGIKELQFKEKFNKWDILDSYYG